MAHDKLRIEYHLEVYPNSFLADPIFFLTSDQPIPLMRVGERVHGGGFESGHFTSNNLQVTKVEHICWKIEDSHVGHKFMVAVEDVGTPRD